MAEQVAIGELDFCPMVSVPEMSKTKSKKLVSIPSVHSIPSWRTHAEEAGPWVDSISL